MNQDNPGLICAWLNGDPGLPISNVKALFCSRTLLSDIRNHDSLRQNSL